MRTMKNRLSWLNEYNKSASKSVSFGVQKYCSKQRKMRLSIAPSNLLPITVDLDYNIIFHNHVK